MASDGSTMSASTLTLERAVARLVVDLGPAHIDAASRAAAKSLIQD
jgi:hypothetical protein